MECIECLTDSYNVILAFFGDVRKKSGSACVAVYSALYISDQFVAKD